MSALVDLWRSDRTAWAEPLPWPVAPARVVVERPHVSAEMIAFLVAAFMKPLKPREKPRSLLEFARTLKISVVQEDGSDKWEPYEPRDHPGHLEVLRGFAAGGFLEDVILGPVQDGKTTVTIVVLILYCLVELRQNAGLMLPTLSKALEVYEEKILPVIMHSGLEWILPQDRASGSGGRGGITDSMLFNTGARLHLTGAGGTSQAAQSSFTVRFEFVDEASKVRPTFIRLAAQRQVSYDMNGRFLLTTTLRDGLTDIIWVTYANGTMARNWFACPLCVSSGHPSGGWQIYDESRMEFDRTSDRLAAATACLRCLHDPSHRITNEQRKLSLRHPRKVSKGQTVDGAGVVTGPAPDSSSHGFLWTCFDSPLKSLGRIAIEWRAAEHLLATTGDHSAMRILTHEQFVKPYTADKMNDDGIPNQLTRAYLAVRSDASTYGPPRKTKIEGDLSTYAAGCPAPVEFLVAFTDVQRGGKRTPARLYWEIVGGAADLRSWDLAWGYLILAPVGYQVTKEQLHIGLERLHSLLIGLASEMGRPLVRRGVDVGDNQDMIRLWLIRHPEWWAMKGAESSMTPDPKRSQDFDLAGWIYRREQEGRWWLHFTEVDLVRRQAQAGFLVPPGQPGAAHLPMGCGIQDWNIRHYCATAEIPDKRGGTRWSDRATDRAVHAEYQVRRDLLDCRTGAVALLYEYTRHFIAKTSAPDGDRRDDRERDREEDFIGAGEDYL